MAFAQTQPEFLAVVVAGSLTKGYGTEASDVDGFIVVSEPEFAKRRSSGEVFWINTEFCDWEGGYIDAKCVSPSWLQLVEERGSEPARSAFMGARVEWSRIDGLDGQCLRIVEYPEAGREDRMRRYIAQIEFARWFLGEGERRDNPYIVSLSASRLALFCGRLLLAHNRVLYPYHKWLFRALADAPLKPEGLIPRLDAFLRAPRHAEACSIADEVLAFAPWPSSGPSWPNLFLRDSEWNWIEHEPPVEDL